MITLTEEQKTKLESIIEKYGSRETAVKLIDSYIKKYTGSFITSAELPDTATFASGIDEIEDCLNEKEYQAAYDIASETAQDMLDEEGFELP